MIYLLSVLLCGLIVAKTERQFSQILYGGEIDLGPYDAKVDIGPLPDRYAHIMSAQDQRASYNIRRLLEMLRGSFATGIHAMPSLDPYISHNLTSIALNLPLLSGKVNVAEVVITGLQGFDIKLLQLHLDNLRTDFAFRVPLLNGVVSFRANLALGGLIPLSFNGRLRAKLENVRVEGTVAAVENVFPKIHFYSFTSLHARFHADDVRVIIDGLNLDNDVLESIKSLDLFGSRNALEPAKKAINYYVAQEVLKQLDDILHKFSAQQVKAYLLAD